MALRWTYECGNGFILLRKSREILTEHPHRPHSHEAPKVRLVRRKQQVEGEHSAYDHAHVCLHLKNGVERGARLRRVFAAGTRSTRGKCCRRFPHCLEFNTTTKLSSYPNNNIMKLHKSVPWDQESIPVATLVQASEAV